MDTKNNKFTFFIDRLKKFAGEAIDKDVFKESNHPSRDWKHMILFFSMLAVLLAGVGIFFYLSGELNDFPDKNTSEELVGGNINEDRIEKASLVIRGSEITLERIFSEKSGVKDPAR